MTFGNTPKDNAATPLGSVYVPNTTGSDLTALEGTLINTDGNGQKSSAARMSLKDGDDVTQGTSTDANTVASVMGRLTKIRDLLNTTLPVSVTNTNVNGQTTMVNSSPVVIASDQSAVKAKSDFTEQTSLSAGSLNADLIPATDVSAYSLLTFQVTGAWVGTLTTQGSDDNSTWTTVLNYKSSTGTSLGTLTTNDTYSVARTFRWFRVRMTSYTSGTANGITEFYTMTSPWGVAASQSGTWSVQPGNTQNTTPWLTQGPITTGTQAANSAANTTIKASAGALWSATITTLGTAGLDIFDNASTNAGTKLLSIPASAAVGTIYAFPAGTPAASGIVSAGVTNCPGVTFSFR